MTDLLRSADQELADVLLRSANPEMDDKEFRETFDHTIGLLEIFRSNQKDEVDSWDNMFFGNRLGGKKIKKDSLGLPILEEVDTPEP